MSVPVVLQALGWLPVVWLGTVHVLVERGRLPRGGRAFRISAGVAAACVVLAGVDEGMWPVAALGLLWLRSEVFGHPRLSIAAAPPLPASPSGPIPAARALPDPTPQRRPHHRSALTTGFIRMVPLALAWLFKIEIVVAILVLLLLFGRWSANQRVDFNHKANRTLCILMGGC
jgi:hypothetical protein